MWWQRWKSDAQICSTHISVWHQISKRMNEAFCYFVCIRIFGHFQELCSLCDNNNAIKFIPTFRRVCESENSKRFCCPVITNVLLRRFRHRIMYEMEIAHNERSVRAFHLCARRRHRLLVIQVEYFPAAIRRIWCEHTPQIRARKRSAILSF